MCSTYTPVFTVDQVLESASERTDECPVLRLQVGMGRTKVPERTSGTEGILVSVWIAARGLQVSGRGISRVLVGDRQELEVLEYRS